MVEDPGSWTNPDNFASTPEGENILSNAFGAALNGEELIDDVSNKLAESLSHNESIKEDLEVIKHRENRAKKEFEAALDSLKHARSDNPQLKIDGDYSREQAKEEHLSYAKSRF